MRKHWGMKRVKINWLPVFRLVLFLYLLQNRIAHSKFFFANASLGNERKFMVKWKVLFFIIRIWSILMMKTKLMLHIIKQIFNFSHAKQIKCNLKATNVKTCRRQQIPKTKRRRKNTNYQNPCLFLSLSFEFPVSRMGNHVIRPNYNCI